MHHGIPHWTYTVFDLSLVLIVGWILCRN